MRPHLQRPRTWLQEMRLPGPERQAARAEREAERQMRRERDNEERGASGGCLGGGSSPRPQEDIMIEDPDRPPAARNSRHSDGGWSGGIPGL